jgi:hypothetical protein
MIRPFGYLRIGSARVGESLRLRSHSSAPALHAKMIRAFSYLRIRSARVGESLRMRSHSSAPALHAKMIRGFSYLRTGSARVGESLRMRSHCGDEKRGCGAMGPRLACLDVAGDRAVGVVGDRAVGVGLRPSRGRWSATESWALVCVRAVGVGLRPSRGRWSATEPWALVATEPWAWSAIGAWSAIERDVGATAGGLNELQEAVALHRSGLGRPCLRAQLRAARAGFARARNLGLPTTIERRSTRSGTFTFHGHV